MNRNFIFLGTGGLMSKIVLQKLVENEFIPVHAFILHQPESPYTNLVELVCKKKAIPYSLISSINSEAHVEKMKRLKPSFGVIASFSQIIREEALSICPFYNVHPGALPENRGAYPVFWDIKNDRDIFTVSIHLINEKIDSGKLVFKSTIDLSNVILGSEILDRIYTLAGDSMVEVMNNLDVLNTSYTVIPTENSRYNPKFTDEDFVLNPLESVNLLFKKINRMQIYGFPKIDGLQLLSATILFEGVSGSHDFEVKRIDNTSAIISNESGILLVKHLPLTS
jgi:methionyl-tRNA formyltransferase